MKKIIVLFIIVTFSLTSFASRYQVNVPQAGGNAQKVNADKCAQYSVHSKEHKQCMKSIGQ